MAKHVLGYKRDFAFFLLLFFSHSILSDSLQPHEPHGVCMPDFPVLYHFPEFAQTHIHLVGNAIWPSNPLLSPSSLAFTLSQHQGFSNELALHISWPKYWSFSFSISPPDEYSGLIFLELTSFISLQSKGLSEYSPAPQFESINSSVLSILYGPARTSEHDHWKNHSFDFTDLCWQSNVSAF